MLAERARRLTPSPTLALAARARALRAQGIDVLSFTAGEPDFDTPERVKDAAHPRPAGRADEVHRRWRHPGAEGRHLRQTPARQRPRLRVRGGHRVGGRQAYALQHLRGAGGPGRRGDRARALLGELHGAGSALRGRAGRRADRRGARLPARLRRSPEGGDRPDQALDPEHAQQPDGRRLSARRPRAGRESRPRARVPRRVRRVLRRARLRGAGAEHRRAGARDQGSDARSSTRARRRTR